MERVDCIVVGAGVVGLAIARAFALKGREVIVLERHQQFGSVTSSRNSEVIHAGIYYDPASLKARFCVEGRKLLYDYCAERGIAHRQLGKLIVAISPLEIPKLAKIQENAQKSGVTDLTFLSRPAVSELEPAVNCVAGLLSPSTGIIDSHDFMLNLAGDAENAGATFVYGAKVESGEASKNGITLEVGGEEPCSLAAATVINAAGLEAQNLARSITGYRSETVPQLHMARGNYFSLTGKSPFSHLVYPVPADGGLGVHVTLDLTGRARFGPDVEWTEEEIYDVAPERAEVFYKGIRRYWPDLPDDALQPDYSGIRPKLSGPGDPAADFIIRDEAENGARGLINLFGIESPGLTASLALANHVVAVGGAS